MTTHSAAERPQDTPGQQRDASGHRKDTPDRFTDLEDGCLDAWIPMAIKGVKVQLTSQIQCRWQYGQT